MVGQQENWVLFNCFNNEIVLLKMPVLFYQGSGIQKFFSELKIMQYFYTRHIINTVGAYSYLEKLIGKNNLIKILIRNYISLLNHPPLEEYEQTMVLIDSLTV